MPIVNVLQKDLHAALGREYTEDEFQDLCFEFGIELDDVTTEKEMKIREVGEESAKKTGDLSDDIVYKIEVPANRYDILCLEGLKRALRIFKEKDTVPTYRVSNSSENLEKLVIKPETAQIRPFCVAAILRNIKFDKTAYNSFLDLQDKLHQNICRKRTLVAIGTHDLDTIQGPFSYEALPPNDIRFKALFQDKEMSAPELLELYKKDSNMKAYVPIIEDSPVYPVIYDANRTVLSMPPIINGEHSKITIDTKNVLIECTATDLTKAKIVLNTMVAMFGEYMEDKFTVENVEVVNPDNNTVLYPDLSTRSMKVKSEYVRNITCIKNITDDQMVACLNRMSLPTKLIKEGELEVEVPITRTDVLHPCDVAEDVAIAYGYNNLEPQLPPTMTIGKQLPLSKMTERLRLELAFSGFIEVLTFSLCSKKDVSESLQREFNADQTVTLANPKTSDFQIARTTLMAGLLKNLACNKSEQLPIKTFEVTDVVLRDSEHHTGAKNERRLCALYTNTHSGFEYIHGLLDLVMLKLGFKAKEDYKLDTEDNPSFFGNFQAKIIFRGTELGHMGVIHPQVLDNYNLVYPVSMIEMNIEPLVDAYFATN